MGRFGVANPTIPAMIENAVKFLPVIASEAVQYRRDGHLYLPKNGKCHRMGLVEYSQHGVQHICLLNEEGRYSIANLTILSYNVIVNPSRLKDNIDAIGSMIYERTPCQSEQ